MPEINKNKCNDQNCGAAKIFAYLAIIYIIACVIYMIMTRHIGTPFKNAIQQYPNLLNIKMNSSSVRSNIFYIGIAVAIIIVLVVRPFN